MILDHMMADGTGLELYREIRHEPGLQEIPVIFYTAAYDWRVQQEAQRLGAKGWFVKGVTHVRDLIDSVLLHRRP